MTYHDRRNLALTASSQAAVDAYDKAAELFHGYYGDPIGALDAALADDPSLAMAHLAKAGILLTTSEKAAEPIARAHVEAVATQGNRLQARETGHVAACRAWLGGDWRRAVELWSDVAVEHPHDALAIQLAHLGDFYLGQSAMLRNRVARVLPYWHEAMPGYGYLLGMHAFGLEECGDYAAAEREGKRAVELNARDPWAIHAVAHVMEMQGRLAEGIRWLESRAPDWSPDNAFAFHNWWHLALYYLDLGDHARVLELYDARIRPGRSQVVLEMIDATAMLWRLTLRGADVGERWRELADSWAPLAEDAHYAFNDVHALMAFVADGRVALQRKLVRAMRCRILGSSTNVAMTREVGLPLANGLVAFGRGQYAAAVEFLRSVRPVASRFGGSHAQRDVIDLTLIEAALRAGEGRLARALASERTHLKPTSTFNWRLTARAQSLLGEERNAGQSMAWSAAVAAATEGRHMREAA